jgi:hypothetical protein
MMKKFYYHFKNSSNAKIFKILSGTDKPKCTKTFVVMVTQFALLLLQIDMDAGLL